MKPLKPSHKENKRYLLLEGKNLKKKIIFLLKNFSGDFGLSQASPRFIEKNILSINRESLDLVRASIALSKEKIKIIKVSGTLKGLKNSPKTF